MPNNTKLLPKDFYNQIVWKVDDIVHNVELDTVKAIDGKNPIQFGPGDLACGGQSLFKVLSYYYFGDCYSLVMPDCLQEAGVLETALTFNDKVDIFIHHEGQFMSSNSRYKNKIL